MTDNEDRTCTAFTDGRRVAHGLVAEVALTLYRLGKQDMPPGTLVFDDRTGRVIDLDLRGGVDGIRQRYAPAPPAAAPPVPERGRGRPKLGVVAREVTLLPRHWDWLTTQPGGASVSLRRLVEEARRHDATQARQRQAQQAAFHFMSAVGGDRPGFEEALRALFANDHASVAAHLSRWPPDLVAHVLRLCGNDCQSAPNVGSDANLVMSRSSGADDAGLK